MPPHVYGTTMDCYRDMLDNKENQSIVISGESGAGKTEETKQAVQFLAHIAKAETEGTGPEQLLLGSSPILEAFGNAKTLKNNNSSRFGKYLEIHFNAAGTIVGGQTIKYLLEKSRIIASIGTGERNYHLFYMLAYLPDDRQEEIKYVGPEGYEYCRKAGCIEVDGIDDQAEFKEMTSAWRQFNVLDSEIMSIYRVVSGVLYLGNVVFEEGVRPLRNKPLLVIPWTFSYRLRVMTGRRQLSCRE
jgi:myosin heavy subunit